MQKQFDVCAVQKSLKKQELLQAVLRPTLFDWGTISKSLWMLWFESSSSASDQSMVLARFSFIPIINPNMMLLTFSNHGPLEKELYKFEDGRIGSI